MKCTNSLTSNVHFMHFVLMMNLEQWLGADRDDSWLAEKLGCSRSQASRIRRGKSRPSPRGAFIIEELSDGHVRANDLLTREIA